MGKCYISWGSQRPDILKFYDDKKEKLDKTLEGILDNLPSQAEYFDYFYKTPWNEVFDRLRKYPPPVYVHLSELVILGAMANAELYFEGTKVGSEAWKRYLEYCNTDEFRDAVNIPSRFRFDWGEEADFSGVPGSVLKNRSLIAAAAFSVLVPQYVKFLIKLVDNKYPPHPNTLIEMIERHKNLMALKETIGVNEFEQALKKLGATEGQRKRALTRGDNTKARLLNAAQIVLADPYKRGKCIKHDDSINVSELWRQISEDPSISLSQSRARNLLKQFVNNGQIP